MSQTRRDYYSKWANRIRDNTFDDGEFLRDTLHQISDERKAGNFTRDLEQLYTALSRIMSAGNDSLDNTKLPNTWDLLGFLFTKNLRDRIYRPYKEELIEDHIRARAEFPSGWAYHWCTFCFVVRTIHAVLECWRVGCSGWIGKQIRRMLPEGWRRFWPGE